MSDEKEEIKPDKLVRVYLKMYAARSTLMDEYDEKLTKLEQGMSTIKKALLQYCKDHNVTSLRTESGLFYRTVEQRYWTNDWEAMGKFVLKHGIPEVYEKRLHQGNMKAFLEENPDLLPPGLNVDREYKITVRKK